MIEKTEMYVCSCNNCGKTYGNHDYDYLVMPDESSMNAQLGDDDEWHTVPTKEGEPAKHYCPDCFRFGENDELVIMPKPNKS